MTSTLQQSLQQNIQAPAILLAGESGSGKTFSLSTLAEAGLELFVISTEPTGLESIVDAFERKKLDVNNLHYKQITPARHGFEDLQKMAEKIGAMTYESLSKLLPQGDRKKSRFIELLTTLNNFVDQKDGKAYGPVDKFGPDRALIIDSLSGLNIMAMDLAVGDKPTAHQGEWGVAMSVLEKLLTQLSSGLRCTFVLTAHLEREIDELTGGQKLMASALGRKLSPKLPRFFSEAVFAYRENDKFYWSTSTTNVITKRRVLPLADKLEPSFEPIIRAYNARIKLLDPEATQQKGALNT